jgi:peptidyl-tRNA hydrolase, PTH1 family
MSSLPRFKYLIGLGNPGPEYDHTYHNVGFLFIDTLSPRFPEEATKTPSFSFLKEGRVTFVKPGTFMNDSGKAIRKIVEHFKCKTEDILLIHDDSDLAVGTYKFSFGKGAAGHRGVLSVMRALKTEKFWRLRIGIRTPSRKRVKAIEIVLSKITPKNRKLLQGVVAPVKTNLRLNEVPVGKDDKFVRGRSTL